MPKSLLAQAFMQMLIYGMTEKIANMHALICNPVQIEN